MSDIESINIETVEQSSFTEAIEGQSSSRPLHTGGQRSSDNVPAAHRGQSSSGRTRGGQSSSKGTRAKGQGSLADASTSGQSSNVDMFERDQGHSTLLLWEIRKMNESFTSSLDNINQRVDELSEAVYNPPPAKRTPPTSSGRDWADRTDTGTDDQAIQQQLSWPDSDMDEEGADVESDHQSTGCRKPEPLVLSTESATILKEAFTIPLLNKERVGIRNAFPPPSLPQTRCPKLDAVFKTATSAGKSEAKTSDSELARLQAYVLDPVAPLLQVLKGLDDPSSTSMDDARSHIVDSLKLLGNASAHISQTRRKRVIKALNPDLQDLAAEDKLFVEASPNLFGEGFEKRMKERAESVKLLVKAKPTRDAGKSQFFQRGRSTAPPRGSGHSNRGARSFTKKHIPKK